MQFDRMKDTAVSCSGGGWFDF